MEKVDNCNGLYICHCTPDQKKMKLPYDDLSFFENISDSLKYFVQEKYLRGEQMLDLMKNIASNFSYSCDHCLRLYKIICKGMFMFSTPAILYSNKKIETKNPVSCFLSKVEDSVDGIFRNLREMSNLAVFGGGIGIDWSNVRSNLSFFRSEIPHPGVIRWISAQSTSYDLLQCTKTRNCAMAVFLNLRHPESLMLIKARRLISGDGSAFIRSNFGLVIPDEFMYKLKNREDWEFVDPSDPRIRSKAPSLDIWKSIMSSRLTTGYPYLIFEDNINKLSPYVYKQLGLKVTQSNLCSEITLATGIDFRGKTRTNTCVLGSLNLTIWDEIVKDKQIIKDCVMALDKVADVFIKNNMEDVIFENSVYATMSERSIGLGVCGFSSMLAKRMIVFGSSEASKLNLEIFSFIQKVSKEASIEMARKIGPCEDAAEAGKLERNLHLTAVAPTSSISQFLNCSEGIQPFPPHICTFKNALNFINKNCYLEKALKSLGMDTEEVWNQISRDRGSVASIDLPKNLKNIFKTGFEIDLRDQIKHVLERNCLIDQSQAFTMVVTPSIDKKMFSDCHIRFWEEGGKTLYYVRSHAPQQVTCESCD